MNISRYSEAPHTQLPPTSLVTLQAPFVDFVLHEAITEGTLPNTLDSCMEYWVEVVRWVQYLAFGPPGGVW